MIRQLGNYQLVRLLGHGSSAEVYLGEHIRLGTYAAVKVLSTLLATPEDREAFEKEARTIANLKYRHIVRVLDYDVEEDIPFLVMDYAPGGTLRQRHPPGTILPLITIVSYVNQIAGALQYAHNQRVIHRDIKPENILLGEHDELLISDFGIAVAAQSSHYQGTQLVDGALAYVAPEQIQGKPCPASDQYSLGIVVYEWLSGDCPFHGSTTEVVTQHLTALPPSLCEKHPTISLAVEQVVLKALAKEPQQRYTSIQTFATALEEASQPIRRSPDVPSLVPSPSSHSPQPPHDVPVGGQSTGSISRRAMVAGLATLAVIGGGVTWLALHQSISPPAKTSDSTPGPTSSPTPTPLPMGTIFLTYRGQAGQVSAVAWSPDGTRIASGARDPDNTVQVWDAVTGQTILVYRGNLIRSLATKKSPGAVNGFMNFVGWLPDSKRIVSEFDWQPGVSNFPLYSYDTVQMWDAASGKMFWAHTASGNASTNTPLAQYWNAIALSPDGTSIAVAYSEADANAARVLQIWNATTGTILSSRNASGFVSAAAWSPDGTRLALAINLEVQVWDVATWSIALIYSGHTQGKYSITAIAWSPDNRRIASVADDNLVHVWDATTGSLIFIYNGHVQSNSNVAAIAWAPDEKRVASVDSSGVQVWDAPTGNHIYTLNSPMFAIAWSPDSTRIVSAGEVVQVWQAI